MTNFNAANTRFCDLLTLAEDCYQGGDFLAAARLVQFAAFHAFPANVGLFGSPRLEQLLLDIAKRIPNASADSKPAAVEKSRHVLHVLSYAKPIGGDSRFVWRWMQEDINSQHSLAITLQSDIKDTYDVPEIFVKSAKQSGGFVKVLSSPTSNPIDQALELRMLCQNVDVVVLHLYPYDIIPVLALGAGCNSVRVLFINHSDHTFWVGASVAHCVVHLRQQWSDFLRKRRGLRLEYNPILPIPIVPMHTSMPRVEAKRLLGYDSDVVLLLTIASPFKYFATNHIAFLDLVVPILIDFPQTVLIAVGPEAKGAWLSASSQTNGRVVPLGRRWDNEILYAAADIYLDSVPFSSITSLLEAGSHEIPLLGYSPANLDLKLLGPGAPGLENTMLMADDAESYKSMLVKLISDEAFRCQQGRSAKKEILSLHTGINWSRIVNDLYQKLEKIDDRGCILDNIDTFNPGELDSALVQLYDQVQGRQHIRQLIGDYIGTLPYRSRLTLTWQLYLIGFDLCYLNLLPPAVDRLIRFAGRRVKNTLRNIFS